MAEIKCGFCKRIYEVVAEIECKCGATGRYILLQGGPDKGWIWSKNPKGTGDDDAA